MNGKKNNNKIVFITFLCVFILFFAFLYLFSKSKEILVENRNNIINTDFRTIKLFIVGDLMLDRNVRNIIDKNSFDDFFSGIKDIIKDSDVSVANLEGPFTPYPSITSSLKNKTLQFTFDPSLSVALSELGFDILGLANNHTLNFGYNGLEMTRRYIGSSGMLYYGDPNNKDEISTIIVKNNIKIGFIGFNEFSYSNFDKVFYEISRLRQEVDVLIVNPHWGIEYEKKPTKKQIELAHEFIDIGADAVIGTHSHIVGDTEEYNGKKIFYSLGNFVFDQYFSDDTMKGLGILLSISKSKNRINLDYSEIPIIVDNKGVRLDI